MDFGGGMEVLLPDGICISLEYKKGDAHASVSFFI